MSDTSITDAAYDLIVVGAGAAGMTAACVGAAEGLRVLLLEKTVQVGGTTAWSGGMVWVPANRWTAEAGQPDTLEAARRYLDETVPSGFNAPQRDAFLNHADEAVAYLAAHTPVCFTPVSQYPDYYPDLPGATDGGRVVEPCPFDARQLGHCFDLLRPPLPEFTLFGGMMISRPDLVHFRRVGRSVGSTWHVAKLVARYAGQRLRASRGTTLYLGNALAGRLLLALTRQGVTLRTGIGVSGLVRDGARVAGVVLDDGRRVGARCGVVLATGGFSHDPALRAQFLPANAGPLSATLPANVADGARLGIEAGGRMGPDGVNGAFWVPVSRFRRRDGTQGVFPHTVTDRAKPGLIAVDRSGRRFVNEAVSYHEFVLAMLRNDNAGPGPAYLLCDRRFLWYYGLGRVKPFRVSLRRDIASGYLLTAPTPRGLAERIGVDPDVLTAMIDTYNRSAKEGHDPEFGRGGNSYQRHLGDAENQPNPCVAPIERAPFYAVAVFPADLGTAVGLVTDACARVVGDDGVPVAGLYACGNDMSSVMNGAYPGPGITLGPALTFGYLAARHAAGGGPG
jgi:succinate dehydrogenase/fumarate reductase flavoprotein subunit